MSTALHASVDSHIIELPSGVWLAGGGRWAAVHYLYAAARGAAEAASRAEADRRAIDEATRVEREAARAAAEATARADVERRLQELEAELRRRGGGAT